MLLSDIIRVGQPIVESEMPLGERIKLLTDVDKDTTKNFYTNVFIVELEKGNAKLYVRSLQDKENGPVNLQEAVALPVTLPSGGNPINAQGIYPIPCYPLYDKHINHFIDEKKTRKMVIDRLVKTIPYFDYNREELEKKTELIFKCLYDKGSKYITENKQLGVLFIIDHDLDIFSRQGTEYHFPIISSSQEKTEIFIDGKQIVSNIIEGRFQEAKELGEVHDDISTISNEMSDELVSAYNKSWLWLSPTWEMPRSIYWEKNEWTKGIRLNRAEYEAFFYGTQFLKQVETPINGTILKEMFAQVDSPEAKGNIRPTSFDTVFGIPYFLPLLNQKGLDVHKKYQVLRQHHENKQVKENDIQLEIISGLQKRLISNVDDHYRITILYYSGILGRGDIHIRGQIEDVVPSMASQVQKIIQRLGRPFDQYAELLDMSDEQTKYVKFKVKYLPTMVSNAYGPGYVWSSMDDVLHGRPIKLGRVLRKVSVRIAELANKSAFWKIKQELLFYHVFYEFYKSYNEKILGQIEGGVNMEEWEAIIERFINGELEEGDYDSTAKAGFISGCLVQQFSRSYYAKMEKGYLDTRIMRFGSKLTPEMVWKNGLLKMEELKRLRDLGLSSNFESALAVILPTILKLKESKHLRKEKDEFMTMFWSGYLMLPKPQKEEGKYDH